MKYLLLIVVLVDTMGCVRRNQAEFHFGDKVTVTRGFYEGCTGTVTQKIYDKLVLDLKCQARETRDVMIYTSEVSFE